MNSSVTVNIILAIIFLYMLYIFPDIRKFKTTYKLSTTQTYLALIIICSIGIALLKYNNREGGVIVFIIIYMLTSAYVDTFELFTGEPANLTFTEKDNVKAFLIAQTQNDPNKTDMEKTVIESIINEYFSKSDKLTQLMDFNISAQVNNPLPGEPQLIQ